MGDHTNLLGVQPGSAEANEARECQPEQPETAEPPKKYLHLYSRESPCSKKKGKKHEWKRDKAGEGEGQRRHSQRNRKAQIDKKLSQQRTKARVRLKY